MNHVTKGCSTSRRLVASLVQMVVLLSALIAVFPYLGVSYEDEIALEKKVSLTPEELQWLSQHDGQIRIGITVIPPQVLRSDGKYLGLSIDYIHLMEQKLGVRFKLAPYATWNEIMQAAIDESEADECMR